MAAKNPAWRATGGTRPKPIWNRAAAMGQNAHRLSVEWSRIEPSEGKWDDGGD